MFGMRAMARDGNKQWDIDSSALCSDGRTNSRSSLKQILEGGREPLGEGMRTSLGFGIAALTTAWVELNPSLAIRHPWLCPSWGAIVSGNLSDLNGQICCLP